LSFVELKALALTFICVLVFSMLGRVFTVYSYNAIGRTLTVTPFYAAIVGLGAWYAWFLLCTVALGVSLSTTLWSFFGFSFLWLWFGVKAFQVDEEMEHFWSHGVFSILLLIPAFIFAAGDAPLTAQELDVSFVHITNFLQSGYFEATADSVIPMAVASSLLPMSVLGNSFLMSSFALLNILLFALLAGAMVKAADIPVKWSNLALVSAGSLLALFLLNPLFNSGFLLSASGDFLFAITLFAACSSFFTQRALPTGWGVVPVAFILVLLVGLKEIGVIFAAVIFVLWLVRSAFEDVAHGAAWVLGLIFMAALPAAAWFVWVSTVDGFSMFLLVEGQFSELLSEKVKQLILFKSSALGLTVLVLLLAVYRFVLGRKTAIPFIAKESIVIVPAVLALVALLLSVIYPKQSSLEHVQFLLLVPLWYLGHRFYVQTTWQEIAYKAPWRIGLSLAVVLISWQAIQKDRLQERFVPSVEHTLRVATAFKESYLPKGAKIAVFDIPEQSDYHASMLRYGLGGFADATDVTPLFLQKRRNFPRFHLSLKEANYQYLWVHRLSGDVRGFFDGSLQPGSSYFFKVNPHSFELKGVFPHPRYK